MKVILLDSPYWEKAEANGARRKDLMLLIKDCAAEVAKKLNYSYTYTNIMVEPTLGKNTTPETGDMGITYDPEHVWIMFDYQVPHGLNKLWTTLEASIHHELVHTYTFANDPWQPDVLFGAVSEGLATVFERDYADRQPLWGMYEDDETMKDWYRELKILPESSEKDHRYFYAHPDGRKWIVYRTGTWIIDKLISDGNDLFDLMSLNHKEIIEKFEDVN